MKVVDNKGNLKVIFDGASLISGTSGFSSASGFSGFSSYSGISGFSATFGSDSQYVSSDVSSTTTSTIYVDKVTLTTGALTGTYWIEYACEAGATAANKSVKVSLVDGPYVRSGTISSSGTTVTGTGTSFTTQMAVNDRIDAAGQQRVITVISSNTSLTTDTAFSPVLSGASFSTANTLAEATVGASAQESCSNFSEVVFSGTSKTFSLQFKIATSATTAQIQRARIRLWRKS